LSGQVVGINTAIFSPSGGNVGIAFAIPASTAKTVGGDLIKNGSVNRGWLGVEIQPVTKDIAESLGLTDEKGALVAKAQDDGPAKKAGIVAGDVITQVEGKDVSSARELARMIAGYDPGKTVELTVLHNGKLQKVKVDLGKLPDNAGWLPATAAPSLASRTPLLISALPLRGLRTVRGSWLPMSIPIAMRQAGAFRPATSSLRSTRRRLAAWPTWPRPWTKRQRRDASPSWSRSAATIAIASSPYPSPRGEVALSAQRLHHAKRCAGSRAPDTSGATS